MRDKNEETNEQLIFVFSKNILSKLETKHGQITQEDVKECFDNNDDRVLEDTREKNKTLPPTQWFISENNNGRRIKVCFIYRENVNKIYIKTAYEPNNEEIRIFNKYA